MSIFFCLKILFQSQYILLVISVLDSLKKADASIYLNYQSRSYMPQDTYLDDFLYFITVNQMLKKENSLCLKREWDCRLKEKLQDVQKNWQVYKNSLQKQLSTFAMLNMYKRIRMNEALNFNTRRNENKTDFYDHLYPKITHFLNFFSSKLGILKIEKYLQKACSFDNQICKNKGNNQNIYEHIQNSKIYIGSMNKKPQQIIQRQLQILRQELEIKEDAADKFFYQLVREEAKDVDDSQNQDKVKVNQSQKLKEYVNKCPDFEKHSLQWTNLISIFHSLTNKNNAKNHRFFKNIENQRLVQNQCLGCSKFFIKNQNIYQQFANRTPVKVFASIRKLKQNQASIKDDICSLLNNGGGIILFNCTCQYRGIYPQGTAMTQKDKQQFEQRIYSYSNQFYPKLQVKKHIHITFVPLVTLEQIQKSNQLKKYTGEEAILKENYKFTQRNYEQGLFVARIKVAPSEPYLVYFWYVSSSKSTKQAEVRNYCKLNLSDISYGSEYEINNRKITKLTKQKINQFYINQSFSDRDKQLLINPNNYIQHECPEPDIGFMIAELSKDKIYKIDNNIQERYSWLSMLIVNKESHNQLKQNLRKLRINFQLVFPKDELNFKIAQNTAALYHNIKFQQLFKIININPNFNFKRKQIIMISVTSFLKLENRNQKNPLYEQNFKQLADKFSRKFPNETLKCFYFKNSKPRQANQYQFYLLTQTKKSTLYLFYLINEQSEQNKKRGMKQDRAVFKNPYLLDKLSQEERQQRMNMIFERKGRNQIISNYRDKHSQSSIVHIKYSFQVESKKNKLDKYLKSQLEDILEMKQKEKMYSQLTTLSFSYTLSKKCQEKDFFDQQWLQLIKQYDYFRDVFNRSQNFQDL